MAKLIFSYHQCLVFFCILTLSQGQVPFDFDVDGRDLIVTGIRNYTVWNSATAKIFCSTYPIVPVDIKILKNSTEVEDDTEKDMYSKEFTTSASEVTEGNYTCRIKFVSTEHKLLYILNTKLQINRAAKTSFCATSVGDSGFEGEEVILICNGRNNRWIPGQESEVHIDLYRDEIDKYKCRNNQREVCNLSNVRIFSSLDVQITSTLHSKESGVTTLSCKSTPPRLLYWRVWGENGDILDLEKYNSSLKVGTNITINQTTGETSLLISEAVPGGNGIYAVECFTYDTKTKVASVHIAQEDEACNKNLGSTITIVLFVIVIITLSILLFLLYFKTKIDGLHDRDVNVVEPQRTPTLHNNAAYVSTDLQITVNNGSNDQEYTYIDQK